MQLLCDNFLLSFLFFLVGRVVITSPNCVREGDSENTIFVITIELISVLLCRDVVYTVELSSGTATGNPLFIWWGQQGKQSEPTYSRTNGRVLCKYYDPHIYISYFIWELQVPSRYTQMQNSLIFLD